MKFLKQIKYEIINILKSKFLLIIGIVVLAASIAIPLISLITFRKPGDNVVRPMPMPMAQAVAVKEGGFYRGGGNGQDPITVDNITIQIDNPFYWQINSAMQEKNQLEVDKSRFTKPESLDLVLSLIDTEIHYYARFAQYVTKPQDYRAGLAWTSIDSLYDKFFYEQQNVANDVLLEAASYRNNKGMDPAALQKKYINITPAEKLAALDKANELLTTVFTVVENNDFPQFIDLSIKQANTDIANLKDNIAIQEQSIIDNPSQEDSINSIIEQLKNQIKMIETNTIPVLEYRLQKNIVPGEDIWQNVAISDIENNRNQLLYTTIQTEENFNKDTGLLQQYGNYQKYVATVQKQIDTFNNAIIVAQKSLDAEKPDMKYVPTGARSRTVQFLDYSVFAALFAVLIGGWLIASEFQQGTIRLLMIRPKTRTKILLSKFIAAFAVSLFIYIVGSLLNLVTNGICFGFSDYAFSNFSIAGQVNFFAYYIPKLLICIIPILFAFTVAFMLSVVVKNTAVSIAVPIVCFVGCFIATTYMLAFGNRLTWLVYTPIPYVQLSSFFIQYSPVQQMMQNGVAISMPFGITLLLVLSAVCTFVSILVFNKRDITN